MRSRATFIVLVCGVLLSVRLTRAAEPAALRPAAPQHVSVIISRETTYVDGPVLPDGTIDYVTAATKLGGPMPPPEQNGAVDLMQVLGSDAWRAPIRAAALAALGHPKVPAEGSFFEAGRISRMAGDGSKVFLLLSDAIYTGRYAPWTARERPMLARLLEINASAFAGAHAAAQKPIIRWPIIPAGSEDRAISGFTTGWITLAEYLSARSMERVGAGQFDQAAADNQTVHRMVAANLQNSSTILQLMIAARVAQFAWRADVLLARNCSDRAVVDHLLTERRDSPEFEFTPTMLEFDRLRILNMVMLIPRGETKELLSEISMNEVAPLFGKEDEPLPIGDLKKADLNVMLRAVNEVLDQADAALLEPPEKRAAALAEFKKTLIADKDMPPNFFDGLFADLLSDGKKPPISPEAKAEAYRKWLTRHADESVAAYSRRMGRYIAASQVNMYESMSQSMMKKNMLQRLAIISIALESYRLKEGHYPEKLEALAPDYLPVVPMDIYGHGVPVYERQDDGYKLHSRGPNGQDDGGPGCCKHQTDDIAWKWDMPYESRHELTAEEGLAILNRLFPPATSTPAGR